MVNLEVHIRNEFFISALFVENMISTYLSEKVGQLAGSDNLHDHHKMINFDQQIEFLLASDKFSIIDKSKLSVFRSIHKEFLINDGARSIEECFTSEDNNGDFLLILYPQTQTKHREEKLTKACHHLMDDVSHLISDFTKKTEVKFRKKLFKLNSNLLNKLSYLFVFLFLH